MTKDPTQDYLSRTNGQDRYTRDADRFLNYPKVRAIRAISKLDGVAHNNDILVFKDNTQCGCFVRQAKVSHSGK